MNWLTFDRWLNCKPCGRILGKISKHRILLIVSYHNRVTKLDHLFSNTLYMLLKCVCLFVLYGFYVQLENFSLIWRRHHYWWKVDNFDLCSALMAIEQWGFFSVPDLQWHGSSFYNGHLRGPVRLTPIAGRLAVELILPVFTTDACNR